MVGEQRPSLGSAPFAQRTAGCPGTKCRLGLHRKGCTQSRSEAGSALWFSYLQPGRRSQSTKPLVRPLCLFILSLNSLPSSASFVFIHILHLYLCGSLQASSSSSSIFFPDHLSLSQISQAGALPLQPSTYLGSSHSY